MRRADLDRPADHRPAAPASSPRRGRTLFLQAAQDINVGGRLSRTQYQYTLQDADLAELYDWSPKVLAKLRTLPMLRDVATDQQMAGTTATLTIDRDAASRFGISRSRSTTRSTTRSGSGRSPSISPSSTPTT